MTIYFFQKPIFMRYSIFFIKKITGLFGLLFFAFFLQAQPNTLVIGKVKNANLVKTIQLTLNTLYLNNNVDVYTSNILDDYTFAFAVEVKEPQVAILEYARNKGIIYLEPNDTLYIDCDAENFQYSFEFSGGLGADNNCFTEYLRLDAPELSIFNMTQYKQKKYWYQCSPKMKERMMTMERASFEKYMQTRKDKALAVLEKNKKSHGAELTKDFKKYFKADIRYDFAYHRMMYGKVFKNRYNLTDDYFDFVDEIPLQSDEVGNAWYREFLIAYFDYQNFKAPDERSDYVFQYEEGSRILEGKTKAFFQSEIITRAFKAKENEVIMNKYWDYMRHQDYGNFDEKVITAYSKALKFAGGTPAPDFLLNDIDGKKIALMDYDGQVIYLNFWATWCRPCMEKMKKIKAIQSELEAKGVVFINVSLDRSEEVWKETIEKKGFKGIHVLASGELNSEIARAYEIKVLPRYFIINKKGVFVKNPKSNDLEEVRTVLLDLVKEQ